MYFGTMKIMLVGPMLVGATLPATAQERGTLEFGAFGNYSFYNDDLRVEDGWGAGIRVGAYIFPRLSVEFDVGRRWADRPDGLESVEVEAFAWRLTAVAVILGPLSVLAGAGAIHTDVQTPLREETDGWQGLLGLKLALGSTAALRVDGVMDFNDDNTRNKAVQFGLSLYRHPAMAETRTITRVDTVWSVRVDTVHTAAAPPTGQASTICLQAGVGFDGQYADGRAWFEEDQSFTYDWRGFQKSGAEVMLACPELRQVGEHQGVPLYVRRDASIPYQTLHVPLRPAVWQAYESLGQVLDFL